MPASALSRHVNIPRSTAKYSCEQLSQKGLVNRINRNNCWYYSPCPPSRLQTLLDIKRQDLESQGKHLGSVINELMALYKRDEVTPKIQFFEGADGIVTMLEDVLKEKAPIYGALYLSEDIHPIISDYFENTYIPERQRSHAPSWALYNDSKKMRDYQEKDHDMNRISMLVPEDEFPFEICFHIYGDKIAFYSYRSSIMTGVIIQDSYMKQMQFSLFKMAWKLAQNMKVNARYKNVQLD